MAQITDLYIYPVKSLKGIALKEAQTAQRGLEFDREWMVTDQDYNFISQREIELMSTIETDIDSYSLILTSNNQKTLKIPLDSSRSNQVRAVVWDDLCDAFDEGDEASRWLTDTVINLPIWRFNTSFSIENIMDVSYQDELGFDASGRWMKLGLQFQY